jgi:hypothetical protein
MVTAIEVLKRVSIVVGSPFQRVEDLFMKRFSEMARKALLLVACVCTNVST